MVNPIQGNAAVFPPQQSALVDDQKFITPPWYLLIRSLFTRTGGGTGAPNYVPQNVADAGAAQSAATPLIPGVAFVSGTGLGVLLSAQTPGQFMIVFNVGAGSTKVYPPSGAQINALGFNAPFALANGKCQIFWWQSNTQIRTMTFA